MKLPVLLLAAAARFIHRLCRRGRSAQHPVDHQRGQRSSISAATATSTPTRRISIAWPRGVIYRNAWSNAPVCAPAHDDHLRLSAGDRFGAHAETPRCPPSMKMYPQYLREAGYYCTNNSKEDYNLEKPGQVWDESSGKAHWRNRRPDQPFFAIFNFTVTHESQSASGPTRRSTIRQGCRSRLSSRHARRSARIGRSTTTRSPRWTGWPARCCKNWTTTDLPARRSSSITATTGRACRGASWPYNSGLRVPMIVSIPPSGNALPRPTASPAGRATRLVGFIDRADAPEPRRHQAARLHAGARFPRRVLPARPEILVRLPRQDGRALRHGPHRGRRALRLPQALHAAQNLRAARRLHVRDPDHPGLEAALRRGQAQAADDVFLADQAGRGALRSPERSRRGRQLGRFAAAPGGARQDTRHRDWVFRIRDLRVPARGRDPRPRS